MVQQSQGASAQQQEISRRQERAQRILDAASTLILRWGYQKTTLDDISRQAGVSKGTIYLHWKTREELFAALIKREKLKMREEILRRITEDTEGATVRGILKHSALAVMSRPLLKAVLLRDMDMLGKLAHSDYSDAAHREKLEGFKAYLELLREHGLVRTDLSLRAQIYMSSAIFMGFLLVASFMPDEYALSDEEIAELMAEAAHSALEPGYSDSPDALKIASRVLMQYLNHSMVAEQERFRQEVGADYTEGIQNER